MNKNFYEINSYILHKLPNANGVIQNQHGIVKIEDTKLLNTLYSWEDNQKKIVRKEELKNIFNNDTNELIGFYNTPYGYL